MPAVYAAIAQDESRNDLIFDDVLKPLEAKRSPVVLTERRDHLEYLRSRFSRFVRNLIVLRGYEPRETFAEPNGMRFDEIQFLYKAEQGI
jgi:hypothetical protein